MFAQNQQNTLPTTGNVGVGTLTPNVKLQVNGSMKVDSSLTVKDTAVFEKQARMKDKIVVESDAVILGTLKAKNDLKVEGTAKLEGDVKMTNLSTANSNDTTLLFVNQNGKVKAGNVTQFFTTVSQNPQAINVLTNMIYGTLPPQCFVGYEPIWMHKPSILWAGSSSCIARVGINTDNPIANIHVEGSGYVSSYFGVGISPNNDITVNVRSKSGVGANADNIALQVDYQNTQPDPTRYAQKIIVNNDAVKALGIVNQTSNADVFRVYGDGKIWATGINIKLYSLFPDYVFDTDYRAPSFAELRSYIAHNKRLPGMPSAKEVEQNGLELDQLVVKQQEKIEELTLYVLELESRLSKLEQAEK